MSIVRHLFCLVRRVFTLFIYRSTCFFLQISVYVMGSVLRGAITRSKGHLFNNGRDFNKFLLYTINVSGSRRVFQTRAIKRSLQLTSHYRMVVKRRSINDILIVTRRSTMRSRKNGRTAFILRNSRRLVFNKWLKAQDRVTRIRTIHRSRGLISCNSLRRTTL